MTDDQPDHRVTDGGVRKADAASVRPANLPDNFQEYSDARFGFRVWMPRRFEILQETIDPLARTLRGLNRMSGEEQVKTQPHFPLGFWDPAVIGELSAGNYQPLRLIEFEAIRGRSEPADEEQIEQKRSEIREFLPATLASAKMPGYEFLGIDETALGPLSGLAFEYRWNGVRPGHFGGDHGFVLWAMGSTRMFHVYHHCSGDQWEKRRPELDLILGSFELFDPAPPAPYEVFQREGDEAAGDEPSEEDERSEGDEQGTAGEERQAAARTEREGAGLDDESGH